MSLNQFSIDVDADGVALVTWDQPGAPMNVVNMEMMAEFAQVIDRIASDEAVKGAVIASGKENFSAGADLNMLQGARLEYEQRADKGDAEEAGTFFLNETRRLSQLYRRLETCGKPVAVAIRGLALGGGLELALACHYRVMANDSGTKVGLPEVEVGLIHGGGGTQRVARLLPTPDALQFLFKGQQIKASMARAMGLVHDVVAPDEAINAAKAWIRGGARAWPRGT